jgi:hypothetical protein
LNGNPGNWRRAFRFEWIEREIRGHRRRAHRRGNGPGPNKEASSPARDTQRNRESGLLIYLPTGLQPARVFLCLTQRL